MEVANRAVWRGQITKLAKSAGEYLHSDESQPKEDDVKGIISIEEELTVLLERIKAAFASLKKANKDVHAGLKKEEFEKDFEKCAEYDDTAISTIARLNQRLTRVKRLQNLQNYPQDIGHIRVQEKQCGVKLPKLQLKTFSGSFNEWVPFWEQFKTAVHENAALSTIDKFNYLQSVLTGKAAEALAGFTPTESCYDGAVALLLDEFGNNEKIVDRNIQKLLSIKPVTSKTDTTGLRHLYNSVVTCTRSLTALGVPPNHYSVMLKTLVLKSLPSELRVDFHRSYRDSSSDTENSGSKIIKTSKDDTSSSTGSLCLGDQQMKALLRYLKREVDSLEKAGEMSRSSSNSTNTRALKTAAGLFATATSKVDCFFCKSNKHFTSECDSDHSITQRKDMLKRDGRCFRCTRRGHTTKSCRVRNVICVKCKKKHATSMCEPLYRERVRLTPHEKQPTDTDRCVASTSQPTLNLCAAENNHQPLTDVFLQTASVHVSDSSLSESSLLVRVIFDGGSQSSFIRRDISRKLNLPVVGTHLMSVAPFGSSTQTPARNCNRVRMTLRSQYDDKVHVLEAIEVPHICVDVLAVPDNKISVFCELILADNRLNNVQPEPGISILIGADQYWTFITGEIKRISSNLTAIHSVFGWTLQGQAIASKNFASSNLVSNVSLCNSIINDFDFRKLWDLETLGIKKADMESETFTKDFCRDYITKSDNRYIASLPWKNLSEPLGNNRIGALSRLKSLTRKLAMEPGRLNEYDKAMRVFISSGFAEKVQHNETPKRVYYMPHRPVYREDKVTTKLRIVFDASAHEPFKSSLNDHIITGSNLLADILKVLLNFRMGVIGVTADIEKAFLQILLAKSDRDSHRFFWYVEEPRSLNNLPRVEEYRMTRVTFGVTCSPFLLGSTIQKHLEVEKELFPSTCAILRSCFYMDDLIASVDSEEDARKLYDEGRLVMQRASMNLRQWNSNNDVIRAASDVDSATRHKQKVLGIIWFVLSDELTVDMESLLSFLNTSVGGTKRNVLQTLSRIYDPLGFFAPYTLSLKILFQSAWRLKLEWDVALPSGLLQEWNDCRRDLFELGNLTFPRCVLSNGEIISNEIHIFSDASLKGYGCVAYVRTIDKFGGVTIRFLISKNRVAPLKNNGVKDLTLPRLELTAAVLASRLCDYLRKNLKITFKAFLWTDSKITLYWIFGALKKWKPYVENRVKEIRDLTSREEWRHCPGVGNPADLLTRGVKAKQLIASMVWKDGPTWLKDHSTNWPSNKFDSNNVNVNIAVSLEVEVENQTPFFSMNEPLLKFNDYSKWRKLLRITSYCFRFVDHTTGRCRQKCEHSKFLITSDLKRSELYWIRYTQNLWYREEINALNKNQRLPQASKIQTLCPVIDEEGLLRVGSRLRFLDDFQTSYPIILPKESHISELIVRDRHEETLHGGVNLVLSRIRERFWIPKARQLIKLVIKQCRFCRMMHAKPISQPFAPLPRERMLSSRPFETTGIDFAGPLYTKNPVASENATQKVYIMLFTCATIRAVHLELALDLTTESCLLGLRRFIARRGTPHFIYSDNARTFKRTSKEIAVLQDFLIAEKFHDFLSHHGITWKFIVERAPWWGGFWERMVRSVKNVLKAAIGKSTLNNDQLNTLLIETEGIINSRPLTYISDDPLDLSPLTPAHFLEGRYATMLPSPTSITTQSLNEPIRKLWITRCKFTDFIWKRWRLEYLQQLRSLHHNKGGFCSTLKPGDVVQVYDASSPRLFWKLAVITMVFPGRDGKIRACEVRFPNGTKTRRPVQLLYPIEIS